MMKKIIFLIFLTLLVFAFTSNPKEKFSNETLSENLISTDNSEITFERILNKHRGKTTLIEVWASWCSDCVKAMPKVKETQINNPNVDYVFLSMDKTFDLWKIGIEKHNIVGDHYLVKEGMKGKFGKSIDLDWIPRYIILDTEGNIVTYKAIETDFEKINETLKSLQ